MFDYKNSTMNKIIQDLIIKKTKEAKKYINDLVQKLIYVKSLERFMDQHYFRRSMPVKY